MEGSLYWIRKHKILSFVYAANLFFSFHYFLVIYINSSFLEGFFTSKTVGILFSIGSILNLIFFLTAPKIIRSLGAYRYLVRATSFELLAILGLAFSSNPFVIALSFIVHQAAVPIILFGLDIFLENATKEESKTGELRGLYLTLSNITLVISPIIVGVVLKYFNFSAMYIISAILIIPLILIAKYHLKKRHPEAPTHTKISELIPRITADKDIFHIICAQFILQFFFAWMVIYTPIYLTQTIGFEWSELGFLFSIMLLPFVIFEIPVGWLADKKMGEKELMIAGFVIIAVVTGLLSIPKEANFVLWATLLFFTRVGASIVEITAESYFFKHVTSKDSDLISAFRMTAPLARIIAPIVATGLLLLMPLGSIFWILGLIVFLGSFAAFHIKDTL